MNKNVINYLKLKVVKHIIIRVMEQLMKKNEYLTKQKKYAWGKYYENLNSQNEEDSELRDTIAKLQNELNTINADIPQHIKDELNELYEKTNKKITCPICLEDLKQFELTNCGHKYCKECLSNLISTTKKCAVCRRKIYKS